MVAITPDALRARFHELRAEINAIEAKSAPLRQEHDRVAQTMEAKCKDIAVKYKEIEAPLFDMKNELGMLARALSGKTGHQN